MSTFNEATLMITGGTGSFGNTGESPNLIINKRNEENK